MIYLFFPIGNTSGWDICGKYLTLELSKIGDVSIVTASQIVPDKIGDELEHYAVNKIPINSIDEKDFDRKENRLKGVSIRTLNDFDLSLWLDEIHSENVIGYTFYIGPPPASEDIHSAKKLNLIVQKIFGLTKLNNKTIIFCIFKKAARLNNLAYFTQLFQLIVTSL